MTEKDLHLSPDFWITGEDDLPSSDFFQKYERIENDCYIVWHSGVLAYYDGRPVDLFMIAEQAFRGNLEFSEILGWYKVVIYQKSSRCWLLFGDNCGSQCFFLDKENACFSDRLLTLRRKRGKKAEINMEALADMICRGGLIGTETPVSGIVKTDSSEYYLFHNDHFDCLSKSLPRFSAETEKLNITDILKPVLEQIKEEKICAVCTGGTDSRAVLAALYALGCRPELILTAHKDNPDVESAKKVSEMLGLNLHLIDPTAKEQKWLAKGIWMTDGMYDAVLGYRHYLKAMWSKGRALSFEFGGVGGEFYKNNYYKPFRWMLSREKDAAFFRKKLLSFREPAPWCSDTLRQAFMSGESTIEKVSEIGADEKSDLARGNSIGFALLSSVAGSITGGYAPLCCKVDPLMDRRLIGSASHDDVLSHALHLWQRRQIAKDYAPLGELVTDQGYSCSIKVFRLFQDQCKEISFYTDRVINRIRKKLGMGFTSKVQRYWDRDYADARATIEWEKTLTLCREKDIIRKSIDDSDIPLNMTGILLQIGLLFSEEINVWEIGKTRFHNE